MKMLHLLELVLFVSTFICTAVTEEHGSCDQYNVIRCMKPITNFRHKLGISDDEQNFSIHHLTSEQLDDYCLDGDEAGLCLNSLVGCIGAIANVFKGLLDSFDYLCKKTINEYKSYQPCLAKPTVAPALLKCDQDTSKRMLSLRLSDIIHDAKSHMCSIVDDDYSCIRNAIQPQCGAKAANWQIKYVSTILTRNLQLIGCNVKAEVNSTIKTTLPPSSFKTTPTRLPFKTAPPRSLFKTTPLHAAVDTDTEQEIAQITVQGTGLPIWAFVVLGTGAIVVLGLFLACCVVCANRRKWAKMRAKNARHFNNVLASQESPTFAYDGKVV